MTTRLSGTTQQASANAAVDQLDVGGAGSIKIYTGSQPADADDAATGTLLVTIPFNNPAYGNANTSGVVALAGTLPLSGTAVAAGTAEWFRACKNDGSGAWDGIVTATGGGGQLTLDNTNIANGQTVQIATLNYTQPM